MVLLNEIHHADCMGFMKLMPDQSVDMILTDIPYGEITARGSDRARYAGQLRKLDKGLADVATFDTIDFAKECARITSGSIYIFCSIQQSAQIFDLFYKELHKDFMVRQCAWVKSNPSPLNGQHMWLSSIENCIFAKRRRTKFNAYCQKAHWEFPVGRSKIHPTEKPLPLFEYLIESSTDKGDLVFDPCIGSGTTAVACVNLDRNYIGVDVNKEYYLLAKERVSLVVEGGDR